MLGAGLGDGSRPAAPGPLREARERAETPPGYVYVSGGVCWLGSDDADADDDARPRRRVFVRSFYIGRCEVTQAEWKRFRPAHRIPAGYERHPVTNVTLEDAAAYCRFADGYLPSEAEWEKAARGTDGRRYPWGNRFDPARCNVRRVAKESAACLPPGARRGLKRADAFPDGASPYGALNMAGNAWEWVSDCYGGDPIRRIIRGGAYGYGERPARTYSRAIEGSGVT